MSTNPNISELIENLESDKSGIYTDIIEKLKLINSEKNKPNIESFEDLKLIDNINIPLEENNFVKIAKQIATNFLENEKELKKQKDLENERNLQNQRNLEKQKSEIIKYLDAIEKTIKEYSMCGKYKYQGTFFLSDLTEESVVKIIEILHHNKLTTKMVSTFPKEIVYSISWEN